ncbi:accelerated cell death 2 [Striga asiatica]|uniref:Accelerated cell death 2 n=1 Tax=Striga asiatica TaxID=4170 RepID=A0A5A7QG59_STRAF|nr:accelerated cell death 2 [Striga asiatica]
MRCLNYNELKKADLIQNRTTAKEYTQCTAYDTYFKKLQEGQPNFDPVGSSRQLTAGDEHEQMDVDDHFLPPPPTSGTSIGWQWSIGNVDRNWPGSEGNSRA